MLTKGIFAQVVAKEGRELAVEDFLRGAKRLIEDEPGTRTWYAIKLGDRRYGIFDTFDDEQGRYIHLHGKVAEALIDKAPELFEEAPVIESIDVLASTTN